MNLGKLANTPAHLSRIILRW